MGFAAMILAMAATTGAGNSIERARIDIEPHRIVLTNGIVQREIHIGDWVATTSLKRLDTGVEFVRSLQPEAIIYLGEKAVPIGGGTSPVNRGFLSEEFLAQVKPLPGSLKLLKHEQVAVESPIPYKPTAGQSWPPTGKAIRLTLGDERLHVEATYEIYDGIPVVGKKVKVRNLTGNSVRISRLISESLAIVEGESPVDSVSKWRLPNLAAFTSMAFGGMTAEGANKAVHWREDPAFETQVNYEKRTPCLLEIEPPSGPDVDLAPGDTLESVRSYLLPHGSTELEARSRESRTFFRRLAPWVEDNPLMLHIRSIDDETVRKALDQAAECGFEMAILSFGSGLNMEDTSSANIAKFKALREYADSKGIRLGGYSLLASRRVDDSSDVINPKTGKTGGAIFGNSPCLGSEWGRGYFERIRTFIEGTGFRVLEHDGSYPGDICASKSHPGHRDLGDSQWSQYRQIEDFYRWCRERDVFLNIPDYYYLAGGNKCGMGYRETNWSLPRRQQHIHARQNLFDGTFDKTPSMGWMFVPLVEYHGGGPEATIEPLKDHLSDYEMHFANTLGYGAQACWRGTRLYDSPETKAMVVRMVSWFKKYRQILESDVTHLRRADGRRLDFVLHENPDSTPKAMLVAYNPTGKPAKEVIRIPLRHAKLTTAANVAEGETKSRRLPMKNGHLELEISVPANGWTYYRIE